MKPSLATALSISGVFAAGATAFAVNSAVLVTPSGSVGAAPVVVAADSALPSTLVSTPDSFLPESVPTPGATPATSGASASVRPASVLAQSDTTATYAVGQAGTVVVDILDGLPVIVSVAPGSGWTAQVRASTAITREAAVIFTGPTSKVIFEVDIENGRFDVDVDSAPLVSAPRHDDDDDHDEDDHHDGDHDEDDDHDEDHDDD